MYKYKLVKKINPQDKAAPKKWYAIPISEVPQTVKAMTRAATENTTTAPIEMEAALELLGRHARQQLQQGHTVRVGDLGTIRVSFKSDGVENITDFNAGAMIKNPRIIFTPSKEFRESVLQGIQFQNAGVLDEGISYASLSDYKRQRVLLPVEVMTAVVAALEVVVLEKMEKMEKVDLVNSHLISLNISLFPSVNKLGLYG